MHAWLPPPPLPPLLLLLLLLLQRWRIVQGRVIRRSPPSAPPKSPSAPAPAGLHPTAAALLAPSLISLQVRSGPVDLPLLKKPVDLTLRRARRLTSRGPDLHIAVRGVAE